jgi:hypothetical protein
MKWPAGLMGAMGLYSLLVAVGLLPIPGSEANLRGPHWVFLLCAGLAFLLGGLGAVLNAAAGADANANLPADAPRWMGLAQYGLMPALLTCFGLIGT